jgi:TPR repeat protein
MKLISALLMGGMLAVSGWAEDIKPEPYSPELVKRAEAGDAKAQYDLGLCYVRADGVTKDNNEFLRWLRKSAEQGYAPAECNLGRCYYYAMGIRKNEIEAMKWLTKAAGQGNELANKELDKIKSK